MKQVIEVMVLTSVSLPFFTLLLLASLNLLNVAMPEALIKVVAKVAVLVSTLLNVAMAYLVLSRAVLRGVYEATQWYAFNGHQVYLSFIVDPISLAFSCLASFLALVVGYFSARYLHRDPGFLRYFCMYLLFVTGIQMVFLGAEATLIVVGWEFVGLSSVLLIGFFQERAVPISGGIWAFNIYRVGDLALLIGMLLIGHEYSAVLAGRVHELPSHAPHAVVMSLLLVAAMVKSAQLPFSSWLPRAMEGPTPSSAIFYGALSIHLGCYLLLRTAALWTPLAGFRYALFSIGMLTALYGSFVGRTRSDIKTQLAYAALAQVGLIFVELSLGWFNLAICHAILHSSLRTLQFLRSPGAYRDYLELKPFFSVREYFEQRYPAGVRAWLYSQSLFRVHLDDIVLSAVVSPLLKLSHMLRYCDDRVSSTAQGGPALITRELSPNSQGRA